MSHYDNSPLVSLVPKPVQEVHAQVNSVNTVEVEWLASSDPHGIVAYELTLQDGTGVLWRQSLYPSMFIFDDTTRRLAWGISDDNIKGNTTMEASVTAVNLQTNFRSESHSMKFSTPIGSQCFITVVALWFRVYQISFSPC